MKTLGLLSTAGGHSPEDSVKVKGVVQTMRAKGVKPVLRTLIERCYSDAFISRRPEAIQARIRQVIDTPTDVF